MKRLTGLSILGCLGIGLLAIVIAAGIDALVAFPVMWIWNAITPQSWHITWLIAFGVLVLLSIFFGGAGTASSK